MSVNTKHFELAVDVRQAHRRLIHVEATFSVQPGTTASFTTPLWLCESHVPNGPVSGIIGLIFSANGETLRWQRDPKAPFVLLVEVPAHVSTIHASFDGVIRRFVTRRMFMLMWEHALLHPAQTPIGELVVTASVTIPQGWHHASALDGTLTRGLADDTIRFAPTTVERLEDSPLLVARHMSQTAITPDGRHILCTAASEDGGEVIPKSAVAKVQRMVKEALTVFGDPPYETFRFLLMQSDHLVAKDIGVGGGMEHSESCVLVVSSNFLADPEAMDQHGDLFSHEYVHAWNGKYRRPAGHIPDYFTTPLDGRLLWVYEGLTQYYGHVLATRSGISSPSAFKEAVANIAADMATASGRVWRSTEDTGSGVALGKGWGMSVLSAPWASWARGDDYYFEGVLLWLDADTLIREESRGRKSLDDFCKTFFSKKTPCGLRPVAYTIEQVQSALNDTWAHDWAGFLKQRVIEVNAQVNTRGLERAGYEFVYSNDPSHTQITSAADLNAIWASIGLRIDSTGSISDVRRPSPADWQRLAPRQTVTHVGDVAFSIGALLDQIRISADTDKPISLRLDQDEDTWTVDIQYNRGLRYPKLLRINGGQDILAAIIAPQCDGY